ncbi:MAG TPA: DUF2961 domain-containing protein, partial [Chryseolinea sp.]|nr:DUF2961 domain-containing protein [Chryseolinea sp.]
MRVLLRSLILPVLICHATITLGQAWYELPPDTETRWSSFENQKAAKGSGGAENKRAKGHPAEFMAPGQTKELMNFSGAGTIRRIWITVSHRTQSNLRAIRLEMYWDGAATPAVSVPLGDFFGVGLGRKTPFENALFSDPEGRSFTSYIPMPFRKGARVLLINESKSTIHLFYDIDFLQVKEQAPGALYFHSYWSRKPVSKLGEDFDILPLV